MPALPANAPQLIRDQAELAVARFVLPQFVRQHDTLAHGTCLCPLYRQTRPFLPEPRFCAGLDEREAAS